jgi:hypothetical protein
MKEGALAERVIDVWPAQNSQRLSTVCIDFLGLHPNWAFVLGTQDGQNDVAFNGIAFYLKFAFRFTEAVASGVWNALKIGRFNENQSSNCVDHDAHM